MGRLPNITNPNEFGGLRQFDYSAGGTRASIEASLERLGLDRIDFVVIHDLDRKMHGIEFDAVYAQAMDECFPVLDGLRTEGVIGSIGISAADTRVCLQAARDAPLDALMMAGSYTLLNHEPLTELLPYCLEKGVSVVIASPFNSGILATGSTDSMYDYGKPTADILSEYLNSWRSEAGMVLPWQRPPSNFRCFTRPLPQSSLATVLQKNWTATWPLCGPRFRRRFGPN